MIIWATSLVKRNAPLFANHGALRRKQPKFEHLHSQSRLTYPTDNDPNHGSYLNDRTKTTNIPLEDASSSIGDNVSSSTQAIANFTQPILYRCLMTQTSVAFNTALQVFQQAVTLLAAWANPQIADKCPHLPIEDAVKKAKQMMNWPNKSQLQPLRLLCDSVHLAQNQNQEHYWLPNYIEDSYPLVPYPQSKQPTNDDFKALKEQIQQTINSLEDNDWHNLSLLTLIVEKFGSFLSFGESDVALIDIVRTTAAVAAAISLNPQTAAVSLIAGDVSGIQKFIYTISSDGALKSLRARSFFLELVIEDAVQQLLDSLNLPRVNVIYAGGGNLYLLASGNIEQIKFTVNQFRQKFNRWLRNTFNGQLFFALDCLAVPYEVLGHQGFADYWTQVTKILAEQKSHKFLNEIHEFVKSRNTYEPCRVCHRDDLPSLKPLIDDEPESSPACWMCRTMYKLGDKLFDIRAVLRSKRSYIKGAVDRVSIGNHYYYFFSRYQQAVTKASAQEIIFVINDWNLSHYKFKSSVPLLLGNYAQHITEIGESRKHPGFIRAEEMVKKAKGIPRVGYLRMDVDRLGQIFAKGLGDKQTLPRIAGLSRQMSYFFKVYLNSLAAERKNNIPEHIKQLNPEDERRNLLFIYAGGDDLFVSGTWNEVVEFAFDVYQCFRAYTGYNPDITLSGGISIADTKFPLYQAAAESGDAEDAAKGNGKDSLGLFGQVFKWYEWLGMKESDVLDPDIKEYLQSECIPKLLGILPFVEKLENYEMGVNYSRNFVRNLLIASQMSEQILKKIKDKKSKEALDTRYYLHLPKIAYTLARLPKKVLNDAEFRTSLKSPYNAPYFRAIATWIELLNR